MLFYCCTFCLIVKNESFGYDQSLLQTLAQGLGSAVCKASTFPDTLSLQLLPLHLQRQSKISWSLCTITSGIYLCFILSKPSIVISCIYAITRGHNLPSQKPLFNYFFKVSFTKQRNPCNKIQLGRVPATNKIPSYVWEQIKFNCFCFSWKVYFPAFWNLPRLVPCWPARLNEYPHI